MTARSETASLYILRPEAAWWWLIWAEICSLFQTSKCLRNKDNCCRSIHCCLTKPHATKRDAIQFVHLLLMICVVLQRRQQISQIVLVLHGHPVPLTVIAIKTKTIPVHPNGGTSVFHSDMSSVLQDRKEEFIFVQLFSETNTVHFIRFNNNKNLKVSIHCQAYQTPALLLNASQWPPTQCTVRTA